MSTTSIRRKRQHEEDERPKTPPPPNWYNQSFIVTKALYDAKRSMSRKKLTDCVFEMEKYLIKEYNLPPLFGGKTPRNTISSIISKDDKFINDDGMISLRTDIKLDWVKSALARLKSSNNTGERFDDRS